MPSVEIMKSLAKDTYLLTMSIGDSRTPGEIAARAIVSHGATCAKTKRLTMGSTMISEPPRSFDYEAHLDFCYIIPKELMSQGIAELQGMRMVRDAAAAADGPPGNWDPPFLPAVHPPMGLQLPLGWPVDHSMGMFTHSQVPPPGPLHQFFAQPPPPMGGLDIHAPPQQQALGVNAANSSGAPVRTRRTEVCG